MLNFSDHDLFEINEIDKAINKAKRKIAECYEALPNAGVATEGDYRNQIALSRNAIEALEAGKKKIIEKYEREQPSSINTILSDPSRPISKNDFIETIRQYVEQGATEEAVALLRLQIADYDPDFLNGAISLSGRFRRAKEERLNNRISRDEYERTVSQIDYAILELLPKKVDIPPNNSQPEIAQPVRKEEEESRHIIEPEMVFVEGGAFKMGGNDSKYIKPIHTVTINSFYIGQFPLTIVQFADFIQDSAYVTTAEKEDSSTVWTGSEWEVKKGVFWKYGVGGFLRAISEYNHPVVHVSWLDATAYCNWMSRKTGKKYRLPSEADWEYAARGGKKTREYQYSGSNDVGKIAWYKENSDDNTHKIGILEPNELGIYDMSGNVWEWCEDFWHENYEGAPNDGSPWLKKGNQNYRVSRGGSWDSNDYLCRISYRGNILPKTRSDLLGFRIVRDI